MFGVRIIELYFFNDQSLEQTMDDLGELMPVTVQCRLLTTPKKKKKNFENSLQKRENAYNQHFLTMFFTLKDERFRALFVWGFTPYQQYFSYLTATVHQSMFPGLF